MRFLKLFIPLLPMLIGLQFAGVILAGKPLDLYLEFPPRSVYVVHASFSWWAFVATTLFIVVMVFPFLKRIVQSWLSAEDNPVNAAHFPWWGWLAVGWLAVAWLLAWNRFPWFESLQAFTSTP